MKTISQFFERNLRAPFYNIQWSWGAENKDSVFLREWTNNIVNGDIIVWDKQSERNENGRKRAGGTERDRHINAIKSGKKGFIVLIAGNEGEVTDYSPVIYPITNIFSLGEKVLSEVDWMNPVTMGV